MVIQVVKVVWTNSRALAGQPRVLVFYVSRFKIVILDTTRFV